MEVNPNQSGNKTRVLIGIFGAGLSDVKNTRVEGRRRRIIRETYLKYLGRFNTSYRVCSISTVLSNKETADDCQIVYTFVIANKKDATNLSNMKKSNRMLMKRGEYESDILFIKVKKPTKNYQAALAWLDAAKKIQKGSTGAQLGHFDFVLSISTDLMIQPEEFWMENSALFASNGISTLAASHKESLLFLSTDVADYFADKKPSSLSKGTVGFERHTGKKISQLTIGGITRSSEVPIKALAAWDRYINPKAPMFEEDLVQDEAVSYSNKTQYKGMPRMLFGIFTTNLKPIERERRDTLRSTYLSFYSKSVTPNRICSLQQLLRNEVKNEECQIAYTFVVGGNPNGPTHLVGANTTASMVIPSGRLKDAEDDVVYLDIKENMEEGKSDTWFRYGYLLSETLYFDYIAKVDTDTVVYPSSFVKDLQRMPLYPWNKRIFGGKYDIRSDYTNKYPIVGPNFMSGLLYWMSPDLADFITDPERCNRKKYHAPFEDLNIGNLIHSHPQMIRRVQMSFSSIDHPVKQTGDFKAKWKKYTKTFDKKKK